MSWEPSPLVWHLDGYDDSEDEEEAVALMNCTGRGRTEHPALYKLLERIPSAAKAQEKAATRKKVGLGRAQILRERNLDCNVLSIRGDSSTCSSSFISDAEMTSTHSAPVFMNQKDDDAKPGSLHSGHGGARKKTRGRGRSKIRQIEKPMKYPFQPKVATVMLPGHCETESEIYKRSMTKAQNWLTSGKRTIEVITPEEKKRLTNPDDRAVDIDRLFEASGTFTRVSDRNSGYTSTRQSSLDVVINESSDSMARMDMSDLDDLDNLDNLPSNSPYASAEVSSNGSGEKELDSLMPHRDQHLDTHLDTDLSQALYIDLGVKDVEEDISIFECSPPVPQEFQDSPARNKENKASVKEPHQMENSLPNHINTGNDDLPKKPLNLIENPTQENHLTVFPDIHSGYHFPDLQNDFHHHGTQQFELMSSGPCSSSLPLSPAGRAVSPNHTEEESNPEDSKPQSPVHSFPPGVAVIRNVSAVEESRAVVRDIVYTFGTVLDYTEQAQADGTIEVTVRMSSVNDVDDLVSCVNGNDILIEDTILEVENITGNITENVA